MEASGSVEGYRSFNNFYLSTNNNGGNASNCLDAPAANAGKRCVSSATFKTSNNSSSNALAPAIPALKSINDDGFVFNTLRAKNYSFAHNNSIGHQHLAPQMVPSPSANACSSTAATSSTPSLGKSVSTNARIIANNARALQQLPCSSITLANGASSSSKAELNLSPANSNVSNGFSMPTPAVLLSQPTGSGPQRQHLKRGAQSGGFFQHQKILAKTKSIEQQQQQQQQTTPVQQRSSGEIQSANVDRPTEAFSGHELIQWLSSEIIPERHYLRRLLTKQDFQLLSTELCSRLILMGVLACHNTPASPSTSNNNNNSSSSSLNSNSNNSNQKDSNSNLERFKPELQYSWTAGTGFLSKENTKARLASHVADKSKISRAASFRAEAAAAAGQTAAPASNEYTVPKYSEQDFQAVLMGIKREHKETLDDLRTEHHGEIQTIAERNLARIQDYEMRVKQCRKKLEAYEATFNCLPSSVVESINNSLISGSAGLGESSTDNSYESNGRRVSATCSTCIKCHKDFFENYAEVSTQTIVSEKPNISNFPSASTLPSEYEEASCQTDPVQLAPSGSSLFPAVGSDDSNSDCRSSISVDSAFCDDQTPCSSAATGSPTESSAFLSSSPASVATRNIPIPPPPPPPPNLTLRAKGKNFLSHLTSQPEDPTVIRKLPVKPKVPMKPLHWKRIQLGRAKQSRLIWSELEDIQLDEDELCDLFSRTTNCSGASAASTSTLTANQLKRMSICGKRETVKVLDEKRSKALAILVQSQHLEISDIATAIFNCDTSLISFDIMEALFEQRPQPEELKAIKTHIDSGSIVPLDRQEQFLWDLSQLPQMEDRIQAIMFQATLPERISEVERILSVFRSTSKFLRQNKSLHWVLSFLLCVGNYMNGESNDRGQADGFCLDILPKLKDFRAKDNMTTILNYTCKVYILRFCKDIKANTALPFGDPSEFRDSASVNFEQLEKQLNQLSDDINECAKRVARVNEKSDQVHISPFKEIMENVLKNASESLLNLKSELATCITEFESLIAYFHWTPLLSKPSLKSKSTAAEIPATKEFFSLWEAFLADLKISWRKEKERYLNANMEVNRYATLPISLSGKRTKSIANYHTLNRLSPVKKPAMSREIFSTTVAKIMADQDDIFLS